MNAIALVNTGLEKLCQLELQEILHEHLPKQLPDSAAARAVEDNVVEFTTKNKEALLGFLLHSQSSRRILISLGKSSKFEDIDFTSLIFPWADCFPPTFSFKVEVENVSGQENRFEIARTVAGKLFPVMEKNGLMAKLELKKPDFLVVVFFTGSQYHVGLDVAGEELTRRHYRIFTHQASMKGDLAYDLVRSCGFLKGEKLLIGLLKDGTIAIEAALFAFGLAVHKIKEMAFLKMPLAKDMGMASLQRLSVPVASHIVAFDENQQNCTAARKNAQLAGVKEELEIRKFEVEDVDVKFSPDSFDRAIFHITTKDERKLNEILYQCSYVLRKGGCLLLIGRASWDLSFSDEGKFRLVKKSEIVRGGSAYGTWLLEKK